jgi:hypothetical protein
MTREARGRGIGRFDTEGAIMARRWYGPERMRVALPLVLVAAALVLGACSLGGQTSGVTTSPYGSGENVVSPGLPSATDGSKTGAAGAPAPSDVARESAGSATTVQAQKLVVVNKTMRIETANVDAAIAKIRELVARDGADISSMQVATASDQPIYIQPAPMADGTVPQTSSGPLRAYVTVRVPSAKYAAFVAAAAKLGTVITESESADDVTQQHVDMVARLGNLNAEQARLRQLFARANTVKDMLAVEQELTRVQGDIESLKAQINYLENQAAMATVTLELSEPKAVVAPAGTDWGVQSALTNSIRAFVDTMNVLIVVLGPVLALLVFLGLPAALIAWLVYRRVKRHRDRVAPASRIEPPSPPAEPDETPAS